MISGAAGSIVVVLVSLIQTHGYEYVLLATILAGLIQLAIGLFRLGKFIRLVPQPAIYGFVNGLAIVIALAQIPMIEHQGPVMYALVALAMLIVWLFPKFTRVIHRFAGGVNRHQRHCHWFRAGHQTGGRSGGYFRFAAVFPSAGSPAEHGNTENRAAVCGDHCAGGVD